MLFFDFSKAFDSVWLTGLYHRLLEAGADPVWVYWIREWCSGRQYCTRAAGVRSKFLPHFSGVPQGGILSLIVAIWSLDRAPLARGAPVGSLEDAGDDELDYRAFVGIRDDTLDEAVAAFGEIVRRDPDDSFAW